MMTYLDYVSSLLPQALARKKNLLQEYGELQVGTVSFSQATKGLAKAKVLFSEIPAPGHWVDPQTGLHVAGRPMSEFVGDSFARNYLRIQLGTNEIENMTELVESLEGSFEEGFNHFASEVGTKRLGNLLDLLCVGPTVHPLDILCSVVDAEIHTSKIAGRLMRDETSSMTHEEYLGDILYLQGLLAALVPAIYRKLYYNLPPYFPKEGSYSRRMAAAFGQHDSEAELDQMTRVFDLLLFLMSYHGPGNVSTNSAVTASSGLVDPWSTFCVMAKALKGSNHGGAAQMGIYQLFDLIEKYGIDASEEQLSGEAVQRIVTNGDPGWCVGHRVIRGGDPRRAAQLAMLQKEFPGSEMLKLATRWYKEALCPVVKEHTGAATSEENVDSLTGVSLYHLGLITKKEQAPFALCIFAIARWVGAGSEVFWKTVGDRRVNGERALSVKPALVRPAAVREPQLVSMSKNAVKDSDVAATTSLWQKIKCFVNRS